jgi:hypothetical protein
MRQEIIDELEDSRITGIPCSIKYQSDAGVQMVRDKIKSLSLFNEESLTLASGLQIPFRQLILVNGLQVIPSV